MIRPRVCILRTDGTNCDRETAFAFELCGAQPDFVHVNELRSGLKRLTDYALLAIPGGFSYGDDVLSGKILAVELISRLQDQLQDFVSRGRPVLGICNGFQVLVRTGLLPHVRPGEVSVTLMGNDCGHFVCRWVTLKVEKSPCIFTAGMEGTTISYQIAHAEGKFLAPEPLLDDLEHRGLVVFRYAPYNPNGSLRAIAGICDPSGRVMGLMPHPERFVLPTQHPNWRRGTVGEPHGLPIFANAVRYAREM